mgnify:CR=1 FL=1
MNNKIILVLALGMFIMNACTIYSEGIHDSNSGLDEQPQFPGGIDKLIEYISENTFYPPEAKKNKITGTVNVQFIITKKGKVKDVEVVESVDPLLDKEAIRVIENMPDWEPGKIKGEPTDVSYQIPIKFSLPE